MQSTAPSSFQAQILYLFLSFLFSEIYFLWNKQITQKHHLRIYQQWRTYYRQLVLLYLYINMFKCQQPLDCSLGDHNNNFLTTLVGFYYGATVQWRRVKSRQLRDACSAVRFLRRHLSYQCSGNAFPQPRDCQDACATFCTHDPSAKRSNCRPFINASRQAREDADVFSEDGRKFSRFYRCLNVRIT